MRMIRFSSTTTAASSSLIFLEYGSTEEILPPSPLEEDSETLVINTDYLENLIGKEYLENLIKEQN